MDMGRDSVHAVFQRKSCAPFFLYRTRLPFECFVSWSVPFVHVNQGIWPVCSCESYGRWPLFLLGSGESKGRLSVSKNRSHQ